MSELEELFQFLSPSSRLDLKAAATHHVLGLTGSGDGLRALASDAACCRRLASALAALAADAASQSVSKDAALALINLSADHAAAAKMLEDEDYGRRSSSSSSVVLLLWRMASDPECPVSDPACMALSNLTIDRANCDAVARQLAQADVKIDRIVSPGQGRINVAIILRLSYSFPGQVFVFCHEGYNRHGAGLHYLGPLLSNLSQLPSVRASIADPSGCVLQRLLPFVAYPGSRVRRGGVVGALRNCCFDEDRHPWIVGEDVDIIPRWGKVPYII